MTLGEWKKDLRCDSKEEEFGNFDQSNSGWGSSISLSQSLTWFGFLNYFAYFIHLLFTVERLNLYYFFNKQVKRRMTPKKIKKN